MKFPFNTCPKWFLDFFQEECLDEFFIKGRKYHLDRPRLLTHGVEYFNQKGITTWVENDQLWFDIDFNTPTWTFRILKWS